MSVLKSKRKPSQFEVFHHLNKVRKEVTDLLLRDFGYSKRKAAQRLEKKFSGRSYEELTDVEKEIYDHFRKQQEAFDTWFIEDERKAVVDCLRSIGEHVYTANSIYPTYYEELVERRVHQDLAIGQCYRLVQELQYAIDFTRRRLEAHLHRFFRENQSNNGYILLMDFSKYYDNIRHDKLIELFEKYVDDDTALWFLEKIVDNEKVDVSYMTDEEYESAMDDVFNSLEHEKVDKSLLTGKKFLRKHLNIGDQVAQDAGIAYPIPIDNYIKIVKGVKFYGRYMDDSYVIHKDKEFLKGLLIEIVEIAHDLGITVNLRKTRICKLSEMWRFLQIQYSLTDTGRVIHKIHPKRLTGMRRKAKKLVLILSEKDFDDWFRSWFNGHCHYMSKLQRSNMLDLCKKLKEEHYYGKTDFS